MNALNRQTMQELLIALGQAAGFTLEEIKELLDLERGDRVRRCAIAGRLGLGLVVDRFDPRSPRLPLEEAGA